VSAASWIAYGALVGALVAAAATLLDRALRLVGRPTRWLWAGALALLVALVVLAPGRAADAGVALRAPYATAPRVDAAAVRRRVPDDDAVRALVAAVRVAATAPLDAAAVAMRGRIPGRVERALAAGWAVLSAVVLLVLAGVHLRLRRARRRWPAAELHGVPVRLAPAVGPAVVGLARGEIVVPRWLLALDGAEQRLVLAHEQEHVRARDPLLLALAWAAVAVVPWHPVAWWMLSRLRLAVELDCDRRVLGRGAAPALYGALLIDLAGQGSGFRVGAPALADTASHLERRLRTMTSHRARFAAARTGALGGLALLALLAACEAKLPTEAQVARMNVAEAESGARRMAMIMPGDAATAYTLDGRTITAAEAHALAPEQIGRIEVRRKRVDGAAATAQVTITSRKPGDELAVRSEPRIERRILMHDSTAAGDSAVLRAGGGPGEFRDFDGLLMIDGARADQSRLRTLAPDQIVSVEVLKGPEAARQYSDAAAAKGVIKITTKAGASRK
jgi:beta-lactamase regulating signal transducer with metallopeptidase domain